MVRDNVDETRKKIAKQYAVDRIGSAMLTIDHYIYFTRAGAAEFLWFVHKLQEMYSQRYLRRSLTKADVRSMLDDRYNQYSLFPIPEDFRRQWTDVLFYYLRDGVNLKLLVGKDRASMPTGRYAKLPGDYVEYATINDLQADAVKWSFDDLVPH